MEFFFIKEENQDFIKKEKNAKDRKKGAEHNPRMSL